MIVDTVSAQEKYWDLCPNCTAKLDQWLNEGKDFLADVKKED